MDPGSYDSGAAPLSPQQRQEMLEQYELFPMYPTCEFLGCTLLLAQWTDLSIHIAFLLAADVVLEIDGQTSEVQSHFHTSSTSAAANFGWGPFQITGKYSHTNTEATSTCEATATGCK
jgi:hypothetical protein